jgi:hypothetical protein
VTRAIAQSPHQCKRKLLNVLRGCDAAARSQANGLRNCIPYKLHDSHKADLTTRARSFRFPRTKPSSRVTIGIGISSETTQPRRKYLRMARSAPPALSSSNVQNSWNLLPCHSTPLTKTGMARGSLGQRRCSALRFLTPFVPRAIRFPAAWHVGEAASILKKTLDRRETAKQVSQRLIDYGE